MVKVTKSIITRIQSGRFSTEYEKSDKYTTILADGHQGIVVSAKDVGDLIELLYKIKSGNQKGQ